MVPGIILEELPVQVTILSGFIRDGFISNVDNEHVLQLDLIFKFIINLFVLTFILNFPKSNPELN